METAANGAHGTRGKRGDTRARIQQVALELFAEQGYERTSLREIAERLDVTKAALYYHFKSKEDIVNSFLEDYLGQLDELAEWSKTQPRTAATAEAVLDRYIGIVMDRQAVFRFMERNQAMIHRSEEGSEEGGKHHRLEQFRPRMHALVESITGPDAPARSRVRATAAFFAVSASCMFFMPDPAVSAGSAAGSAAPGNSGAAALRSAPDPEELRKIVVELADDIIRDINA